MTAPANQENLDQSATDEDEEAQELLADAGNTDDAGADQLGDAGKKALDRMKAERKQLKDQLNAYKGLGLSAEDLRALIEKSQEDSAKAEQARQRQEAESAALSKANERLIRAEVKAAATGKLANPALALRLLDLKSFDVNDDGEVDSGAISDAISALLESDPYLGVTQGETKRFQGTGDGGPKGNAGKPQLTRQDVERLAKEGKHAEIEKARQEGRLNDALGIT